MECFKTVKAINHNLILPRRAFAALLLAALLGCLALTCFAMTPVTVSLPVRVTGAAGTLALTPVGDAPSPEPLTLTLEGTSAFAMRFSEPGDYRYELRQLPGSEEGVRYDGTIYRLLACVTVREDASLAVTLALTKPEGGDKVSEAAFVNERESEPPTEPSSEPTTPPTEPSPTEPRPKPDSPHTGDESGLRLWYTLAFLSLVGLLLLLIGYQHTRRQERND